MPKFMELPGASPPGPPPGLSPGPAGGLTAPPRPPAVFLVPMVAPLPKCFQRACILDFIMLIKMDFTQEAYIKRRLFGRQFENMACPSLTKCYMRCITIGQTFSDTFSFVELERSYISCTSFKDGHIRRLINKCVKP